MLPLQRRAARMPVNPAPLSNYSAKARRQRVSRGDGNKFGHRPEITPAAQYRRLWQSFGSLTQFADLMMRWTISAVSRDVRSMPLRFPSRLVGARLACRGDRSCAVRSIGISLQADAGPPCGLRGLSPHTAASGQLDGLKGA